MKNLLLSTSFFLLATGTVLAQTEATPSFSSVNLNNSRTFDERYSGVKGSPFILDEWYEAILNLGGDEQISIPHVNFDRHTKVLCFRESKESETKILSKYKVLSFKVLTPEGDSLFFFRDREPGGSDQIYLEEIYREKCLLCLDHAKQYKAADYEQVYSLDRRHDEFNDQPVYYIRTQEGDDLQAVKKNKKQSALIFKEKSDEILRFLKTEKIDLGSREGIMRMVLYYESLTE